MSKAVLISIRQKWCQKIMAGQKTIEVRKTRPKLDTIQQAAIDRMLAENEEDKT